MMLIAILFIYIIIVIKCCIQGPNGENIGAIVQPLPYSYLIFRAPSEAAGFSLFLLFGFHNFYNKASEFFQTAFL